MTVLSKFVAIANLQDEMENENGTIQLVFMAHTAHNKQAAKTCRVIFNKYPKKKESALLLRHLQYLLIES